MKSEIIEYRDGGLMLKGFVAFDDSNVGKRPRILVPAPHPQVDATSLVSIGYLLGWYLLAGVGP